MTGSLAMAEVRTADNAPGQTFPATSVELTAWVESFREAGFVVIPHVLSREQVVECRAQLHADLAALGVQHGMRIRHAFYS